MRMKGTPCLDPESPRSKVSNLLEDCPVNSPIKRTLTFHFALLGDLKAKYIANKKERVKQVYGRLFTGKLVRKYKLQQHCQHSLGFSYRRWKKAGQSLDYERNQNSASANRKKTVKQFFLRDDISRLTTGKRNTVTVRKMKKQRRLLCDSLLNLHRKFLAENQEKISYAFFCRQRPFWVMAPTDSDRETCQCKTHENIQFMADKLFCLGLATCKNIEEMSDATVCDAMSRLKKMFRSLRKS